MKIRFLDSFRFLPASLDKLSQPLDPNQCIEMKEYFNEPEKIEEIRHKRVFLYSYIDSIEKHEDQNLPNRESFFDVLKNSGLSNENHLRACNVWKLFA